MALGWDDALLALATFGSGAASGGEGGGKTDPNWSGRRWGGQMAKQYPEFEGLPKIAPEAMELVSKLMQAKDLPPGIEKALGIGMERGYGAMASGLSERGAGLSSLAMGRGGMLQNLAQQRAGLLWEGLFKGLEATPGISELMMKPYDIERNKWTDIAQMFIGADAAKLKEGQTMGKYF